MVQVLKQIYLNKPCEPLFIKQKSVVVLDDSMNYLENLLVQFISQLVHLASFY